MGEESQIYSSAGGVSPLAQLAEPADVAAFRAGSWPRQYRVFRPGCERLPQWLQHPALQDVGALPALCPRAKFAITHSDVPYQVPLDGLSGPQVRLLLRFGLTVSVAGAAQALPGARAWMDGLAAELGLPPGQVDTMLFSSAPGGGLSFHFDAYDAFVVQLHGSKTWRLSRSPGVESPIDMQYVPGTPPSATQAGVFGPYLPEPSELDVDTLTLDPGSILFVPRGTWHQTAAAPSASVSASVLLNAPGVGDVLLQQLRQVIAQDARLRAPARGFAGDERQREHAARVFERGRVALGENLARLTPQAAFESHASPRQLASVIAPSTRFARNPSRRIAAPGAAGAAPTVELELVDTAAARPYDGPVPDSLVLPPVALAPLGWVMERPTVFSAGELAQAFPDLHFESLVGLLAELVAAKALLLLPFGPAARTLLPGE